MSSPSAVTIGVFDGVHTGHQSVIRHCVQVASEAGLRSIALTFDPNPIEILRPDHAPTRLCTAERRVALIRELGVDEVEVLRFDRLLSEVTADEFVRRVLIDRLNARHIVIGQGFRFGHKARGTAQTLTARGLVVDEYPLIGGESTISSTRVRAAVAEGDVVRAAEMLGRPHGVEGSVVAGMRRGRDLGFPTANVATHELTAIPADGVYAGVAVVDDLRYLAAISIGTNPTFGSGGYSLEAHLLDFDGDLYGRRVRLDFRTRLRPTVAFPSTAELVAQMHEDVAHTRAVGGADDAV